MPLQLEFIDGIPGVLWVRATGTATLDDMFAMIDEVAARSARLGLKRVLVDQTGIQEEFKFTDHFSIGGSVVKAFATYEKAASIVRESRRSGTSEKVAQRQGVQLRVFISLVDARAWLVI